MSVSPRASTLRASMVGNRARDEAMTTENAEDLTARLLLDVEDDSIFFDQMNPFSYAAFETDEVQLGEILGKGEFGVIFEVKALHVSEASEDGSGKIDRSRHGMDGGNGVHSEGKNSHESNTNSREEQNHYSEGSTVETSSDSTLSQRKGHQLALHLTSTETFEEDEELEDGENQYLREYMSKHVLRHGQGRYAVKRVRRDLKDPVSAILDLAVEAKFLASIKHPNIVRMRGTSGVPGSPNFMMVMDRLSLTLKEKIRGWNRELKRKTGLFQLLSPAKAKQTKAAIEDQYADKLLAIFDIARAIRYLHNHMIVFRDLKPENVAIDVRGDMRVFDFGLAKELKARDRAEDDPDSFLVTGLCGSRVYMAPEVALCRNYGLKADVYSFAILSWEVLSGQEAYVKMTLDSHFDQVVVKGQRPKLKAANAKRRLSEELQVLLADMWKVDPKGRPSFAQICETLAYDDVFTREDRGIDDRTRRLTNLSLRSKQSSFYSSSST